MKKIEYEELKQSLEKHDSFAAGQATTNLLFRDRINELIDEIEDTQVVCGRLIQRIDKLEAEKVQYPYDSTSLVEDKK